MAAEPGTGLIIYRETTMATGPGSTDAENGAKWPPATGSTWRCRGPRGRGDGRGARHGDGRGARRRRRETAAEPAAEPAAETAAETAAEPAAETAAEPAAETGTETAASASQQGPGWRSTATGVRKRGGPRRLPRRRARHGDQAGPLRPAVPGGFTLDDFTIDEDDNAVTCPAGITRQMSATRTVTFGAVCAGCRCASGAPPPGTAGR